MEKSALRLQSGFQFVSSNDWRLLHTAKLTDVNEDREDLPPLQTPSPPKHIEKKLRTQVNDRAQKKISFSPTRTIRYFHADKSVILRDRPNEKKHPERPILKKPIRAVQIEENTPGRGLFASCLAFLSRTNRTHPG
jgi:hypothetical protein